MQHCHPVPHLVCDLALRVDAPAGEVDEVVLEGVDVVDRAEGEADGQHVGAELDPTLGPNQTHVRVHLQEVKINL